MKLKFLHILTATKCLYLHSFAFKQINISKQKQNQSKNSETENTNELVETGSFETVCDQYDNRHLNRFLRIAQISWSTISTIDMNTYINGGLILFRLSMHFRLNSYVSLNWK